LAHGEHVDAPRAANVPTGHVAHDAAPTALENVPVAHWLHCSCGWPVEGMLEPAAHAEQTVAPVFGCTKPAAHEEHVTVPVSFE
jgi:hypothetical protein